MRMFSRSINKKDEKEKLTPEDKIRSQHILDLELVKFVINEFPEVGEKIKDELKNLINTIEGSIDIIEEKSTEVIKENRDYQLGGKYRDTSAKMYQISNDISEYVSWMEKNLNKSKDYEESEKTLENEAVKEDDDVSVTVDCDNDNYIKKFIYEDFTGVEPVAFIIDKYEKDVDGWDDIIVKTADILTKNYKNDKNLKCNDINIGIGIINRKSKQNELRDIVIEMLEDHNISLNSFAVYIKK